VSPGLRRTLLTQTRRLNELARRRFEALGGDDNVQLEGAEGDVAEPDDATS